MDQYNKSLQKIVNEISNTSDQSTILLCVDKAHKLSIKKLSNKNGISESYIRVWNQAYEHYPSNMIYLLPNLNIASPSNVNRIQCCEDDQATYNQITSKIDEVKSFQSISNY